MRFDIAIIGAGPAGLSAALTSKVRNKSVILFGSDSEKITKTSYIRNYLGFKETTGKDLNEAFKRSLEGFDIKKDPRRVKTVYAMGDFFAIDLDGEMVEAKSVIMANGVDLKKDLENEEKFFARGVNYCASCDAALYRGKSVVVIGYNDEAIKEAEFTSEIVGKLTFVNMTGKDLDLGEEISIIEGEVPQGFDGDMKADTLIFKSGRKISADGFFIIKDSTKADRLVPSIEMDGPHIRVGRKLHSSITGLFAAGDIVGRPYQIMKAVGEGQVAAMGAVSYLSSLD